MGSGKPAVSLCELHSATCNEDVTVSVLAEARALFLQIECCMIKIHDHTDHIVGLFMHIPRMHKSTSMIWTMHLSAISALCSKSRILDSYPPPVERWAGGHNDCAASVAQGAEC